MGGVSERRRAKVNQKKSILLSVAFPNFLCLRLRRGSELETLKAAEGKMLRGWQRGNGELGVMRNKYRFFLSCTLINIHPKLDTDLMKPLCGGCLQKDVGEQHALDLLGCA